ncbi:hypothetical protein AVEN_133849-1 [Araneus ventricosus]|uniref:Uncharacterized protein n=1 Tax=Araneus ventricosus TaxID=182803 RepID=A0A4Y2L9G2_ARAVE|nr:hypothetical protein AVEN_133849-1 [Araneus ventricosus]
MLREESEEWVSIDEDIPVAAAVTDLEICQAVCEQDPSINVDDSNGDESIEENPPKTVEMRQAHGILKLSTSFNKQYDFEQYISELLRNNCRQATLMNFFNCYF